jgi:hypothetical protein
MKKFLGIALVLGAGMVMGPEQAQRTNAAPAPAEPPRRAETAPIAVPDDLDVAKLVRRRTDMEVEDLFGNPAPGAPIPPPAQTAKAEPVVAAPTPPPLPFSYLGRMTKGGKAIVYLLRNGDMVLAETGVTLDGTYLVENISSSTVDFVYLPLQARQALNITQAP